MKQSKGVISYRWAVFLLAAFYFTYGFYDTDHNMVGWQYRFLTNWALAMSVLSAFLMLQRSLGRREGRHEVFASTTVVVNFMVVLLYWKIYWLFSALLSKKRYQSTSNLLICMVYDNFT